MADIFDKLVLCLCIVLASLVSEAGSQTRHQSQKNPPQTTERVPLDDMLSVLQEAMSGNEVSFSALESLSEILPADLTVESVAVPFVDNTRVKWSVPQKNKQKAQPTTQQQRGNNLENIITSVAQLGNKNVDLNKLLQASSVVIPLDNLQFLNGGVNNNHPNLKNVSVSNPNGNNRLPQASETRQIPVRRINTVRRIKTFPVKFPKSNTAIYIPSSLLSRIRRQTPKGFLVLPVMANNRTASQKTAKLQIPNINNGSVLLVVRRSPGLQMNGSQPVENLGQSRNVSSNIQGIVNRQAGSRARRPASVPQQTARSVNLNNQPTNGATNSNLNNRLINNRRNLNSSPINNQRILNQPIRARGTAGNVQSASTRQLQNSNRLQGMIQPRRPVIQRPELSRPAVPQQGRSVRQSQISGIVSRNRPLVQTISSNGRFPRTQSLRTGQTGQVFRRQSRPTARRIQPIRRPAPPPDPFTSRFSAGFTRGSSLLVQPPFENTTFFNADGTRVTIDSDVNGNIIRRTVAGPGGMPLGTPMLPQTGLPFGGGVLPGAFPGPVLGGFGPGFGSFGII